VATSLIADGHRVTVLAPEGDGVADIESIGCRFFPLKMSIKGLNPLEEFNLFLQFKQVFHSEKPDIIFSYTIKNNIFGAMAAESCGIPFVPNVTGLGTAFLSGKVLWNIAEKLYRRAFRKLPIIFFQNENDRRLFVQRGLVRSREQTRLIPGSGIDLEKFAKADYPATDTQVFLMIARLLRNKGVIEYVEAARRVKDVFPKVQFRLLGPADCASRSAIDLNTVKGWHSDGMVEYLGVTSDVRSFIEEAHSVVLPSHGGEGAPRALIEAAAMGRPAIATDVPGCRSVIDEGKTGLMCEARNCSSLTSTLLRFISLPHTDKAEMGCAGRAKMVAEYDQAIVLAAYRQAVAELVVER